MRAATRCAIRVAALAALGFALLIASSGCSLLKYTKTAPPPAPIKPPVPHELAEGARQGADYVERFLAWLHTVGAVPQAPAVEHAKDVAAVVVTHLGRPAEPLPLVERVPEAVGAPVSDEVPAWAKAWMRDVTSHLAQHSARMSTYDARIDRYGRTPVKTGWKLSSPALGGLFGTAVLALVLLVVVTVLFGKVGLLKRALVQIIGSFQAAKRVIKDSGIRDDVVEAMSRKQDAATEAIVKSVKGTGRVR